MKYTIILKNLILVILSCCIYSCEKFVDIKRNNSQRLIETAKDAQYILDNYGRMNLLYPADGELSADDYYITDAGFLSIFDQANRDIYTWSPNAMRNAEYWQNSYLTIYYANIAIETAENLKGKENEAELNNIKGQGLFFRANVFFQISQIYSKPYSKSTASTDLGIPLRLRSDINDKVGRGTLEQTYNRIIADLEEAAGLLSEKAPNPSRPNKAAALGLLARVYLSMEDYSNALRTSTLALALNRQLIDFNTLNPSATAPFPRFNREVIFHSVLRALQPLDPGSATSNIAKIDPMLISLYSANDLRLSLFFKINSGIHAGTYRFAGNYESTSSAALFNGIAVDEIYLIHAECNIRVGSLTEGLTDINNLLRSRWKTGTYIDKVTSSRDEALQFVLQERRKELVMRGQRWTDLRRLNMDLRFSKNLNRSINGSTYTLPPNDLRYTLLIPNEVISNSDFLISQNPR